MTFYNDKVALASGGPLKYKGLFIDSVKPVNDEQIAYKEKLFAIIRKKTWCLVVLGTVGNGKTLLAVSGMNYFLDYYPNEALYITQEELMDKVKATYDDNGLSTDAVLHKYETVKLLIIDEVTTRNWTEHTRNVLARIINRRYADNRRFILIGNITEREFSGLFEEHTLSRLRTGLTQIMTAPDMRKGGQV